MSTVLNILNDIAVGLWSLNYCTVRDNLEKDLLANNNLGLQYDKIKKILVREDQYLYVINIKNCFQIYTKNELIYRFPFNFDNLFENRHEYDDRLKFTNKIFSELSEDIDYLFMTFEYMNNNISLSEKILLLYDVSISK